MPTSPPDIRLLLAVIAPLAGAGLVMLTGRKMVRFPDNVAPGVEPEHCRRMSPMRSVRPSART